MDQNVFVFVPIGTFLLLGLGFVGWSIATRQRELPVSSEEWRKELIRWRILSPTTSSQTLTDVKRCRDYLVSTAILAAGISIVLAMIGWMVIALVTTDTSVTANVNSNAFFLASTFLSTGIGFGIGAVVAARHLRRAAQQRITYADLRQRRLSDYRSNAFRWLAMTMIVWTFGVFALIAPHAGPTLQIDLWSIVVSVPNTVWGWCIVPGTMLLIFVLIEIVLFRIVGGSRLLVTSDATVSQHADDMLRAIVIGLVLYCELLALGQLATLPFYIFPSLLRASHYWQGDNSPYLGLLGINLYMPVVMQVLGIGILLGRGRLGGKLSGWPWNVRQMKQPEGGQ